MRRPSPNASTGTAACCGPPTPRRVPPIWRSVPTGTRSAAALLAAALRACPDAQDRDLIADVVPPTAQTEPATIWLTETSGGGLGLIEQLVRFYTQDPRRFWGLVDSALGPSDYEYTDAALTHLLSHVVAVPARPGRTGDGAATRGGFGARR